MFSKLFARLFLLLFLISPLTVRAQTTGTCERGEASADLDVANVRARLFSDGPFFRKDRGNVYNVPKAPEGEPVTPNALFAAGIWLGGLTPSGELRMAAADYYRWEFWPSPLDDDGNPPEDCTPYDRIFKVSDEDVRAFDEDGTLTDDLRDWPYDLGANAPRSATNSPAPSTCVSPCTTCSDARWPCSSTPSRRRTSTT